MFELTRDSRIPLVDQICERLTQLVRSGQLPTGTRLPSIRKLARLAGTAPSRWSMPTIVWWRAD